MTRISGSLITFNPAIERLKKNIDAITPQVTNLIIVDNGSTNFDQILEICKWQDNIIIIANKTNTGIACALNQAFRKSISLGCDLTLTLDQDSVSPPNLIEILETYQGDRVGIICPLIVDINRMHNEVPVEGTTKLHRCISSGSLTSNYAWGFINGFDEEMFIDGVDFDFCDRLIKSGFEIIRVNYVKLIHEIGKIEMKSFL